MSTTNKTGSNPVKGAIQQYLTKRSEEDAMFATTFTKPNKSIDECYAYILGEMRKRGNAVAATEEEVYGLAVHYYDEDDIKVSKVSGVATCVRSAAKVELTEEEKAKAREQAIAAYRQQCIDEERAKEKKRNAKQTAEAPFSPSLFTEDMLAQ
ncbi:MAG: PcfK-like family protein [Bacteroidales bacterium]|nr:PcfK-like family protein [Bacteroidales bacterium]